MLGCQGVARGLLLTQNDFLLNIFIKFLCNFIYSDIGFVIV